MRAEDLFRAIGSAKEEDIARSQRRPARPWVKWTAAAAACVCLAAAAIWVLPEQNPGIQPDTSHSSGAPTEQQGCDDTIDGVQIPALTLPEGTDSEAAADMMLTLVVYQGRIYTQGVSYYEQDEVEAMLPLLGEHLGRATGTIDEWSTQEEYATEFASNCDGEVYAVNGYSTEFRVCIRTDWENEAGETETSLQFLEHLNGITLDTGSDLFEERLHMTGNIASVSTQTFSDWDSGSDKRTTLTGISEEAWDVFWSALMENHFLYAHQDKPDIYSASNAQAFLYCTMADGTEVALRLIEGGYVGYDPMGWYFVQLPEEVFTPIFQAALG